MQGWNSAPSRNADVAARVLTTVPGRLAGGVLTLMGEAIELPIALHRVVARGVVDVGGRDDTDALRLDPFRVHHQAPFAQESL